MILRDAGNYLTWYKTGVFGLKEQTWRWLCLNLEAVSYVSLPFAASLNVAAANEQWRCGKEEVAK